MRDRPKFPSHSKVLALPPHPSDQGYVVDVQEQDGQSRYRLLLEEENGCWVNYWYDESPLAISAYLVECPLVLAQIYVLDAQQLVFERFHP